MFKDFEGKAVTIFATTKGSAVFRYEGLLKKADHILILENATISAAAQQAVASVFGKNSAFLTFAQDIETVGVNPEYIISIY